MLHMLRVPAAALLCTLSAAVFLASCNSKMPVVVGSKNGTEETLLGEIVAQHLEHRLGRKVQRRLGLGDTAILYQSLISGVVSVYPEYTGLIESDILNEQASSDPQIVLARVRGQMDMRQLELLDPLGFNDPSVMVVRANGTDKFATLSDAAGSTKSWRLGVPSEFQSRSDGLQELASYRLPMDSPRVVDPKQLFSSLANGDVDMIAARATDGHLTSPDWKILADDRKVFPPYEAVLLVRKDAIAAEPALRPALAELSGKINANTMRKLNAEVDVMGLPVDIVATEFLTQAGLK
jgi:osmoprotectant transport system substrate-binding protein